MKQCPTCHREFTPSKRICFACKRPIKARHKWHVDGSIIRHDDCLNPALDQVKFDEPLLASQESES